MSAFYIRNHIRVDALESPAHWWNTEDRLPTTSRFLLYITHSQPSDVLVGQWFQGGFEFFDLVGGGGGHNATEVKYWCYLPVNPESVP